MVTCSISTSGRTHLFTVAACAVKVRWACASGFAGVWHRLECDAVAKWTLPTFQPDGFKSRAGCLCDRLGEPLRWYDLRLAPVAHAGQGWLRCLVAHKSFKCFHAGNFPLPHPLYQWRQSQFRRAERKTPPFSGGVYHVLKK